MKALIPGSFDPVTNGHVDLIRRAAAMFDTVTVGVFVNSDKKYLFSAEQRAKMIAESTRNIKNVNVITDNGYVADYCKDNGIGVIVKGVRNAADYEYELKMADYNKKRNPYAETVLLPAYDDMASVSSSAVRQMASNGEDISAIVPECVIEAFKTLCCY